MRIIIQKVEHLKKLLCIAKSLQNIAIIEEKLKPLANLCEACKKIELASFSCFVDIPDINIVLKPKNDVAWYTFKNTITISLTKFNNLQELSRDCTIAHEVAHHIIGCRYEGIYWQKYKQHKETLEYYLTAKEDSFADYIVNEVFKLPHILTMRGEDRKNEIVKISSIMQDCEK